MRLRGNTTKLVRGLAWLVKWIIVVIPKRHRECEGCLNKDQEYSATRVYSKRESAGHAHIRLSALAKKG